MIEGDKDSSSNVEGLKVGRGIKKFHNRFDEVLGSIRLEVCHF